MFRAIKKQKTEARLLTDIVISEAAISLREGDSTDLTATIYPENATNKNVVWSSSDGSTVSVDNGIIKAHRIGSATIIVKSEDGGITASCQVAVTVNYIAFETESGSNFAYFDRLYANLEYSDNNADWHPCEVDLKMPFGNGSKLYLRGYGNNVEDESHMIGHIILGDNTKVVCTGNIMTLLDYENPQTRVFLLAFLGLYILGKSSGTACPGSRRKMLLLYVQPLLLLGACTCPPGYKTFPWLLCRHVSEL